MAQESKIIYSFLSLTKGSWRNAFYIDCPACPYKEESCCGHLLATDADGAPLILPVSYFEKASGEKVDKAECAAVISREAFEGLFHRWLLWNVNDPKACGLMQLTPKSIP